MAGLIGPLRGRIFPSSSPNTNRIVTDVPPSGENYHNWGEAPRYEDAINPNYERRVPQTAPDLTPYLGARSRLSQVWFNRWTVLILLILVRVMLATISLDNELESARDKAFSACTGVESMGSAMASMPFYMAAGVNEMTAKGIETAVRALEDTLLLMITGVQEIVVFIVNLITSTYVCLITLAVRGSVEVMVDALKEITDFVNGTMNDIFNSAENDVKGIEDGINKVKTFLDGIPGFFNKGVQIPNVNIPSLDKLKNGLTIPDDFKTKLDNMEKSLPTFQEVKDAANDAIRIPFQLLTQKVNSSLGTYEFDRSVFPVPQKEKLTFCSNNSIINNFFDNLKDAVLKVKKILLGVLAVLAILAMIPMGYREWHTYRTTRRHAYMLSDNARDFDPVDVVYIATRPHSSVFGLKLAKFFKSVRRQVLVRWAIAYITSPPALFVLSLGLAGLVSVLCQYIVLKQIQARTPELAAEIGKFAGLVVDKLEGASKEWTVKSNDALNRTNAELNQELFGWVKDGTDSLNGTLNTFVDKMHDGVDTFLGGTPLAGAVKDVLDCLITLKIEGIQKAITWAHDHAHVTFPLLPDDAFSRGALKSVSSGADPSSSFLSNPHSMATDQITDVVMKLTNKWEKMITQEAQISAAIVGVWLIVVLVAIIRTLVLFFGRDLNRGEGGSNPSPGTLPSNRQDVFGNRAAAPVFPTFGTSPNTPYPPSSPEDYPNEKIQMGRVNTGLTNPMENANRESYYPKVQHKQ
ncbi:hypothetical protein BDD12DRAFT_804969 [Trichophaea hybrida]|nr:hypothetical protein BDD12DRAFT_804969 [Trichophaea hybrida]